MVLTANTLLRQVTARYDYDLTQLYINSHLVSQYRYIMAGLSIDCPFRRKYLASCISRRSYTWSEEK